MTPVTFRGRAAGAIGTPGVEATARGARRFTNGRLRAVSQFAPFEELRDQARTIRLETIANLDHHIELFAQSVTEVGGEVVMAKDAASACRAVVDVALQENVQLAVKSKSMISEEIELNHALQAAGVDVVETDLGELIVQLAEDRPSHIIAPVLHRTRQEIGRLFADRLGVAYTEEPSELNQIARSFLREKFLRAQLGVSGVNFGVAATGSICTVTNEGNGRLVTTAPKTHVALMGIERLVPGMAELAVMLELLARSATGQRLSVYTNIVTGPRRSDEPDGPDRLVVVMVDNGRSALLGTDLEESLACIRCGACLNICPVYRTTGGHAYGSVYSGPIGAVLSPALFGEDFADLPYASSLCGACREVCPIRIDLPRMLLALRAKAVADGHPPAGLAAAISAYAWAATDRRRWAVLLAAGGMAARLIDRQGWITGLPGPGRGWTSARDLPAPPARIFRRRWQTRS